MNVGEAETRRLLTKMIVGAVLSLPVLVIAMSHGKIEAFNVPWINWLQLALTTPVMFWCGWQFFRSAWKGLGTSAPTWTRWWRWAPARRTSTRSRRRSGRRSLRV
jgi:cation transport ATPase